MSLVPIRTVENAHDELFVNIASQIFGVNTLKNSSGHGNAQSIRANTR